MPRTTKAPPSAPKPNKIAPKKRKVAPKRRKRARKPPAKMGRPSVWDVKDDAGTKLEARICETLQSMGCSFRDAAEFCGISHETLKARQRADPDFSARLAHARLRRKMNNLGTIAAAADAGNIFAARWHLERVYPEEFGARVRIDDGSAAAAAAAEAAREAEFQRDIELGDRIRETPELLADLDHAARGSR